eukprot:g563.t1
MPTFVITCDTCDLADEHSVGFFESLGKMGSPHELIPDDEKTGPFRRLLASRKDGFCNYKCLYCHEAFDKGYTLATKGCKGVIRVKIQGLS